MNYLNTTTRKDTRMSGHFGVPVGSSSPPSTPDKSSVSYSSYLPYGENPSTTPAGPPPPSSAAPSSAGSFTPAGAPSASYLGSSIMRGMTGGGQSQQQQQFKQPLAFGDSTASGAGSSGNLFGFSGLGTNTGGMGIGSGNGNLFGTGGGSSGGARRSSANNGGSKLGPLGRSIRGGSGKPMMQRPSKLSKTVIAGEEDEEDEEEGQEEETAASNKKARYGGGGLGAGVKSNKPGTFSIPFDDTYDESEEDAEGEEEEYEEEEEDENDPRVYAHHDVGSEEEGDDDMWLGMEQGTPRHRRGGLGEIGDESDLMMLNTPAATERVRREAEDIFRASAMQPGGPRRRQHKFATQAKGLYNQMGTAPITEPLQLILRTEALMNRLYDDGVGEADDEEKLDDTLAAVGSKAAALWKGYADKMPHSEEEHAAEISPGPNASPLEKAAYLANLALRVHHSRFDQGGMTGAEPLPQTLFQWQDEFHNLYGSQIEDILRYRPSPACHSLFWQTVFVALLRGKVQDASKLLKQAGWGHVRRGQRGEYAYQGKALDNVERAAEETAAVLETCPGFDGNWEIWSSDWTLFRVRAQGSLEHLRRFAEGKDEVQTGSIFGASRSARGRDSMAGLARRAESQVPWEIYENLNIIFDIVLGTETAILEAAQDWVEATIGLLGWWDDGLAGRHNKPVPGIGLSRSQALIPVGVGMGADTESYLDRLSRAFHVAVETDLQLNPVNEVELGIACIFEDNAKAVIGILRGWSLPIAAAVAEIASLGKWLPPHQAVLGGVNFPMEDLDMADLEVLGMDPGAPDDVDGIKDSTLVQYAQALAEIEEDLGASARDKGSAQDGWELAIQVLGRLDSSVRSEEMVGELVNHLIQNLHVDSEVTVDKVWAILNELGMVPFAEETAETYGDILSRDSHRYGEAMWYFALAHRPNKVREVMNLLIAYSLIQSTAYPPNSDLDDHLHRLLTDRADTLKAYADTDLEAAELLGKMLSGYASLRQFYEIRDNGDENPLLSSTSPADRRRQAAAALVSVIASSDDNIRGGLLDQTRDGIVSEDFLLALLGEALVFVSNADNANVHHGRTASPAITLDQIDVVLKAVEDLEAVGSRVYGACDEFLSVVLASAPGGTLKGSTPADLLKSVGGSASSSTFGLAGTSLVASQLQKSLSGAGATALGKISNVKRGWDWRAGVSAKMKGEDVMKRLRLGLAKDLASLWLLEADGDVW